MRGIQIITVSLRPEELFTSHYRLPTEGLTSGDSNSRKEEGANEGQCPSFIIKLHADSCASIAEEPHERTARQCLLSLIGQHKSLRLLLWFSADSEKKRGAMLSSVYINTNTSTVARECSSSSRIILMLREYRTSPSLALRTHTRMVYRLWYRLQGASRRPLRLLRKE